MPSRPLRIALALFAFAAAWAAWQHVDETRGLVPAMTMEPPLPDDEEAPPLLHPVTCLARDHWFRATRQVGFRPRTVQWNAIRECEKGSGHFCVSLGCRALAP